MKIREFMENRKCLKTKDKPEKQSNNALTLAKRRLAVQICITVLAVLAAVALSFGLTTAWYSNVIQTESLRVQADTWGFTGTVTVGSEPIVAAPGDSGVIPIAIQNDDDAPVDVRVDITKEQMTEEMQKRIYFYVETPVEESTTGETVRIYLNSQQGYLYREIPAESTLTLTEDSTDGPLIRWEWVYDVLGYFVLGTVEKSTATDDGGNSVTIGNLAEGAEYLQPVKYDLDSAVFDSDGSLTKIISKNESESLEIGVEDFVMALYNEYNANRNSRVTQTEQIVQVGNYYAVDVDEDNYGVWLCLYTLPEIQAASQYDTQLGEAEEPPQFEANLIFTGQNAAPANPTEAATQNGTAGE